jgi:uracil-DNA glycosylase|tara:strand:+ start:2064 stop:2441 length:378 start_codon:yes stop_codon:yes gene_type:complete
MNISKRFENGLKRFNITPEELKKDWKYCGGDRGRHLNYYKVVCPDEEEPPHEDRCICGHRIKENCYITDGKFILNLGNCCVKRFLQKTTRSCEVCGSPHRNRKDNRCRKCRRVMFVERGEFKLTF